MNNQKPEPRTKGDGSILDFHSMFFTIQGEGPFAGHRAIFVRLAGCNLQCPGCDTEYTQGRFHWSTEAIAIATVDMAHHYAAAGCLVVITGGEPLRQPIGKLVQMLVEEGHSVQIESNGVFAPDELLNNLIRWGKPVSLIISPKTHRIHPDAAALASAFKYVLDANSVNPVDGLPVKALDHPASTGVARPREGVPIYLNPFDAGDSVLNQENLVAVARSCIKHGYIAGVQLHKLIGLE